jgi:hypothetical protein
MSVTLESLASQSHARLGVIHVCYILLEAFFLAQFAKLMEAISKEKENNT